MSIKISNININDLVSYCVFPNSFIRNGKITPQQKILFEILCSYDYLNEKGERKGYCDPSLDTISKEMGLAKRSVQVHLKRLVEKGLVSIIYRNNTITGSRSNIYILNILPGLSRSDIARIAKSRNIEIKNLISGLNTIRVKTSQGLLDISPEEFDLQFITTGQRSSEVIEGEIVPSEEIISKEEEEMISEEELNISKETELRSIGIKPIVEISPISFNEPKNNDNTVISASSQFSFKKVNLPPRDKVNKCNSMEKDVVKRILNGDFTKVKAYDICKYFKYKYKQVYNEIYIIDRIKDTVAIKNRLKELEMYKLVDIIDYFIEHYKDLFYSEDYKRPKVYMLNIAWIMNKVLENYEYANKQNENYNKEAIKEWGGERMQF